jgi:hypothetical protein
MNVDHIDGWLVVQRHKVTRREPAPPLTHEEVRRRYRGFDGIAWPSMPADLDLCSGLAPVRLFEDVVRYWKSIRTDDVDCVCLCSDPHEHSTTIGDAAVTFCGYDYGNFVSEYNCFSSVLNEVIYGVNSEMAALSTSLNGALLYDTTEQVDRLETIRRHLKEVNRPLETEEVGEEFAAIGIFALSK